jgi:glutamyl/glutaminyl-tRNA synthetase
MGRKTCSWCGIADNGGDFEVNFDFLKKIILIYQERLKKVSEIAELTDFFFKKELKYEKELLKWKEISDKDISSALEKLKEVFNRVKASDWIKENLEKMILSEAEKIGPEVQQADYGVKDRGYLLWPLRVALTGKRASAGPFEIAAILGKEKTLKRIIDARAKI